MMRQGDLVSSKKPDGQIRHVLVIQNSPGIFEDGLSHAFKKNFSL
jgi:hypothetical protein